MVILMKRIIGFLLMIGFLTAESQIKNGYGVGDTAWRK